MPSKAARVRVSAHAREFAAGTHFRPPPPGNTGEPDSRRGRLSRLPEFLSGSAGALLTGISVYREPADRSAVLFQVGLHDWTAARAPDPQGPTPPYQPPADLAGLMAVCAEAGLLTVGDAADEAGAVFVEPWLAAEWHRLLVAAGRAAELAGAHRRAAQYWQWRAAAWPQGRPADIHDLLEARQHLLQAGDIDEASDLTAVICAQLSAWGDLGRAADLIQATLDAMPSPSAGRAGWLHELGATEQVRGDHAAAEVLYLRAVEMSARVGDTSGVARGYESLGVLAQASGDYRKAERHYRAAAAADRRARASAGRQHPPEAVPDGLAGPEPDPAARAPRRAAPPLPLPPLPDQPLLDQPSPAPPSPAPPSPAQPSPVPPSPAPPITGETGAGETGAGETGAGARSARSAPSASKPRSPRRARRPARREWLRRPAVVAVLSLAFVTLAATTVAVARVAGSDSPPGTPGAGAAGTAADERGLAAAWVAGQVSSSAVVACDPAMCAALRAHGVPAGDLLLLGPGAGSDPLGSDIVVATAAIRSEFGARLAGVYAPLVVAGFGTGSARVEVRVTALDGSAAYDRALRSDERARAAAGAELLRNDQLSVTPAGRSALTGGRVDARMLTTIAAMADVQPLRVLGFGDSGPGAAPGAPLRSAEIAPAGPAAAAGPAALRPLLAFLRVQRPPYLAASISVRRLPTGQAVLHVEFDDPSPLGLLTAAGQTPAASTRHR